MRVFAFDCVFFARTKKKKSKIMFFFFVSAFSSSTVRSSLLPLRSLRFRLLVALRASRASQLHLFLLCAPPFCLSLSPRHRNEKKKKKKHQRVFTPSSRCPSFSFCFALLRLVSARLGSTHSLSRCLCLFLSPSSENLFVRLVLSLFFYFATEKKKNIFFVSFFFSLSIISLSHFSRLLSLALSLTPGSSTPPRAARTPLPRSSPAPRASPARRPSRPRRRRCGRPPAPSRAGVR